MKTKLTCPKAATALLILIGLGACEPAEPAKYELKIYRTSEAGDQLKELEAQHQENSKIDSALSTIKLNLQQEYQEIIGFGASFTESSAWNLACLPDEQRKEVLRNLFSPEDGAGFSLTRTHINSCDYSNNHYSYIDEGDERLESFSIHEDLKGFSGDENNQVRGIELVKPDYDLIPMIKEAQAVPKAKFKIIASPWSPPSWMKTDESSEMTNGHLLPKYYPLWARYLSKYISSYQKEGINIWALTPQNEPLHAKDARWESNGFSPEEGKDFLQHHLGPQLVQDGHLDTSDLEAGLKVLIYDHNKSDMLNYVQATYQDPGAAKYAWGTAFHWYASSHLEQNNWYAEDLEAHQKLWPNKALIHSESSIDIDPNDPIGQYWRLSSDYGGVFIPFDTYVLDILKDLNHGTQGYVEWCMALSHKGQPNPYDNFNSAPVLVNPQTKEVLYTPLYYILSHFSKFIRPGAVRIGATPPANQNIELCAVKNEDGSVTVVLFNRSTTAYALNLELENDSYPVEIAPRSLQTFQFIPNKTLE